MKRMNFPGRRVQRQIDAKIRAEGRPYRNYTSDELARMDAASQQRSKRRAA